MIQGKIPAKYLVYWIHREKEFLDHQRSAPPPAAFSEKARKARAEKMRGRSWTAARRAAYEASRACS